MPDLLDRVRAEIRERLDAGREAVREYDRLQAALAALDSQSAGSSSRSRRPPRPEASGRGRRRSSRPTERAPRGANREAVLRVVADRPGVTPSELAAASGVQKRTLYTLLSTLTKQGALERQELPGGQTGYRVSEDGRAGAPAPEPGPAAATREASDTP